MMLVILGRPLPVQREEDHGVRDARARRQDGGLNLISGPRRPTSPPPFIYIYIYIYIYILNVCPFEGLLLLHIDVA